MAAVDSVRWHHRLAPMWVVIVTNLAIGGLGGLVVATITSIGSSWLASYADSHSRVVQLVLVGVRKQIFVPLILSWLVGSVLSIILFRVCCSIPKPDPVWAGPVRNRYMWALTIHTVGWGVNLLWWLLSSVGPVWPEDWSRLGVVMNGSLGVLNRLDMICFTINAIGLCVLAVIVAGLGPQMSTLLYRLSATVQVFLGCLVVAALAKLCTYGVVFPGADTEYVFLDKGAFGEGLLRVSLALASTGIIGLGIWRRASATLSSGRMRRSRIWPLNK